MAFAGMNYLAILAAGVAAWITGALWYGVLSKHWVAALGKTMEAFKQEQAEKIGKPTAMLPFLLAFIANLIMAWVLAGVIAHLGPGQVTIRNGIISAAFVWLGFVVTTIAVNNAFGGRKVMLTVIDSGHWLAALMVAGAVIGAFGV
jgi:hypothetical protein